VIVRPGQLLDDRGDDLVTAGPAVEYGSFRRDNVAAFIAAVLANRHLSRAIVGLTDGSTPVDEAVATLVAET
jgi:hypothetical protein